MLERYNYYFLKMGFDINIEMVLSMCKVTGKPYYLGANFEHIYDIGDIVVPEHLKEYLVGRGPVFHAYTSDFNYENRYNVSVYEFLEHYPSWEDVHKEYEDHDYWTEDDHNKFKELLEWCKKQCVDFRVSWSY